MDFNESIEAKSYYTLNEAKDFRKSLWSSINDIVDNIKEDLFDELDMENNMYLREKFFDKEIFNLDKVEIVMMVEDIHELEKLFELKIPEKYKHDSITYYIYEKDTNEIFEYLDEGYYNKNIADIKSEKIEQI